jgi:hypothetical protein
MADGDVGPPSFASLSAPRLTTSTKEGKKKRRSNDYESKKKCDVFSTGAKPVTLASTFEKAVPISC